MFIAVREVLLIGKVPQSRAGEENQQVTLEFLSKMKLNIINVYLGLQDTDVSKANRFCSRRN